MTLLERAGMAGAVVGLIVVGAMLGYALVVLTLLARAIL